MIYQVVVDSPKSALVKTTYLIKEFTYIFLKIEFTPKNPKHTIKDGVGTYQFISSALLPPPPRDDPKRFHTIRAEYHKKSDINTTIKASSLREACKTFASTYHDIFELVEN
jgi:hypothetical protein